MIGRLSVRCGQLGCFLVIAWLARQAGAHPVMENPTRPTSISLSILGEKEQPDGSWSGVDLLNFPDTPTQRFQIALRPTRNVRVVLDALNADGTEQRLYPMGLEAPTFSRGKAHALPAPDSFYELDGSTRLRLTVVPDVGKHGAPTPMLPVAGLERVGPVRYRLSDGTPVEVSETVLETEGTGVLEFALSSSR